VVNWVFFQVSIAVLLDNFLTASNEMKTAEKLKAIQQTQSKKLMKNPLDPLLLKLAKEYTNDDGLSSILQDLFKVWLIQQHLPESCALDDLLQVLDSDNSGGLSSHEFQAAIKKLVGSNVFTCFDATLTFCDNFFSCTGFLPAHLHF
jgi:hypothetical protein